MRVEDLAVGGVRCSVFGVECLVLDVWCLAFGVCCLLFVVWCLVTGVWWCKEFDVYRWARRRTFSSPSAPTAFMFRV